MKTWNELVRYTASTLWASAVMINRVMEWEMEIGLYIAGKENFFWLSSCQTGGPYRSDKMRNRISDSLCCRH